MTVLQSELVQNIIKDFNVPEVPLVFVENPEIAEDLLVLVPSDFDKLPQIIALQATLQFNKMMVELRGIGVNAYAGINYKQGVITK